MFTVLHRPIHRTDGLNFGKPALLWNNRIGEGREIVSPEYRFIHNLDVRPVVFINMFVLYVNMASRTM